VAPGVFAAKAIVPFTDQADQGWASGTMKRNPVPSLRAVERPRLARLAKESRRPSGDHAGVRCPKVSAGSR
jgi:hypothetical protein